MKSERINWLDVVKFIACLGVMSSHFLYTFLTGSIYGKMAASSMVQTLVSLFSVPLNGNFWVFVFCILSGFLLRRKKINGAYELLKNIFIRYLRFAKPFAVTAVVIFLLDISFGFVTQEMSVVLENKWLQEFYTHDISLYDYICFVLAFDSGINGPVWMIKALFLGNCLVYVLNYLWGRFNALRSISDIWYTIFILLVSSLGIYLSFSFDAMAIYVIACLMGAVCPLGPKGIFISSGIAGILLLVWVVSFTCQSVLISDSVSFFYITPHWNFFYALCFVLLINNLVTGFDSCIADLSKTLGKLSFPIYLFHWPLFCSAGLILFDFLLNTGILTYAFCIVLTSIAVTVMVGIIAVIYAKFVN